MRVVTTESGRRTLPALRPLPRLNLRRYAVAGMVTLAAVMVVRDFLTLLAQEQLMRDVIGYWLAGEHVRAGADLYYDWGRPFGSEVFLFAPWFAYLWAPLTLLPREVVLPLWTLAMLGATGWAVSPFFRQGLTGIALGCVLGYCLAWGAMWGNVMPLLVGALIHTHGSRRFPLMVGLAASLKVLPILYLWPYVAERRWRPVLVGVGVMAAMWLPALWHGLDGYPTGYMPTLSLLRVSGWLWGAVAAFVVLLALRERLGRYRWLATTLAILALYPRVHLHYIGLIGVGHGRADRVD